MERFISYEGLPIKSGGSHALGKKPADKVYRDTITFLNTFTNAHADRPVNIELIFYSSQNKTYKTLPHLWRLIKCFGIPRWDWWDTGKAKQHFFKWGIWPRQFQQAYSMLAEFEHLPENEFGPLVLGCSWHFHFIDPATKQPLPQQDQIPVIDFRLQNSRIYLRLQQRSTISVWFVFPFEELNETSRQYLAALSAALPFRPSGKHWRLWKKSKAGNWNPSVIDLNDK